jgi:N-acetylmuramoyl-L-alanine amidase
MKQLISLLLACLLLPALAPAATVEGVRLWTAPDHTRLVFDVDAPVDHALFMLQGPERLVIDLKASRLGPQVKTGAIENRQLRGLRHGKRGDSDLRIVLDLKQPVRPKSFLLKPQQQYGHRLVIDLFDREADQDEPRVAKSAKDLGQLRDIVVAVDPGHGGEDPGAIGRGRTHEKIVTLQIARRLKALIDAEPGMRAVLTRDGDYYVGLRKRMQIAREQRADLFVSIHADAFRDKRVHGSSVYVLSRRGASSEAARWLAAQENSADLVGGVSLDDKDEVLASVLLDLSQSATQQASLAAAQEIYQELHRVGKVHGGRVQQAGFVVLKSPDIPSMLVETGFISNPQEERRLTEPQYQQRMARAMLGGIKDYFQSAPPPGTLLAQNRARNREHVIRIGDTLSEIAARYQVSLNTLRQENQLRGDVIRVGQVLRIPEG